MNRIPWHRSNTLRGVLVALVLQILQWAGVADQIDEADTERTVENLMQFAEFAALLFAAWARTKQPTPPISETARAKMELMRTGTTIGGGTLRSPWWIAAAAVALALLSCTVTPAQVVREGCERGPNYRVERCAETLASLYEIYQRRALEAVRDENTAEDVKASIRATDARATPVVRALLEATAELNHARRRVETRAHEAELALDELAASLPT